MHYYVIIILCQHGGIGRRTGLKIQRWQHRAGSTPAAGIYNLNMFEVYFFRKSSPLANNFILQIRILFLNNFFKVVIIVKYILKGSYLYE